jgi:hypothetical protein
MAAGASQGTKDRYYLPPDGRIVLSASLLACLAY